MLDTFVSMDLIEAQIDIGVVMFDGHVLELFVTSSERFHVRLLTVTVSGADKKGRRRVTLAQPGNISELLLDEAEFEGLQPIFEGLRAAGVKMLSREG
jgi:hypothetical protein